MWLYKRVLQPAFKIEVDGIEEIPREPCIFIANHNIGALIEILALHDTWHTNFPDRPVFGLAHPIAFKIPGFSFIARKIGAIPATFEAAFETLEKDSSLIIFPGGNWEAVRPFTQRDLCDFGSHFGWAKLVLRTKHKVVPIAISGSHSVNPVLFRSRELSYFLILPELLGIKYFPLTLAQIILPILVFICSKHFFHWAAFPLTILAFLVTALFPILPAKIRIRFCPPVDLQMLIPRDAPENVSVKMAYARILNDIQAGMDDLRDLRNSGN